MHTHTYSTLTHSLPYTQAHVSACAHTHVQEHMHTHTHTNTHTHALSSYKKIPTCYKIRPYHTIGEKWGEREGERERERAAGVDMQFQYLQGFR